MLNQGGKISWSEGIEIIQSLFSYHYGIRNQYQKIFETNTDFQVQCDIYQERPLN